MLKQRRKPAWILFVLIQAFLGSCIGIFALSGYQIERLPAATYINDINIGGLDFQEASVVLNDYNDLLMRKGRVEIAVNHDRYTISYDQIDGRMDVDETLDKIFNELSGNSINHLVVGENARTVHEPVVVFNTGKLSAEIENIFSQYGREPVSDSYRIENGRLVYTPEISGIRADYTALERRITAHIHSLSQEALVIEQDDPEIFVAFSSDNGEDKEAFKFIVSSAHIRLAETDRNEEEGILEGLNGSTIPSGEMVQLSKMLDLSGLTLEGRQDLVNRTATAVYQAFLPIEGITPVNRRPSEMVLPYSEPGLEAVISGENGDLVLENSTGQTLMLLCEIRDKSLHCYVISPENIPSGVLVAHKKDVVEPPVIYSVNSDLKKGETRIVTEGREGFTIHVERVIGNDRGTLYTDRYDPVSRVVEVGDSPLQKGSK